MNGGAEMYEDLKMYDHKNSKYFRHIHALRNHVWYIYRCDIFFINLAGIQKAWDAKWSQDPVSMNISSNDVQLHNYIEIKNVFSKRTYSLAHPHQSGIKYEPIPYLADGTFFKCFSLNKSIFILNKNLIEKYFGSLTDIQ